MKSLPPDRYMQRAMELALRAKGQTSPNPLVGAVLVKKGRIIAEGWHRRCGTDHAEIVALKKAGPAAKGAVLYVTLEPCRHFGRTPPCVDAVIKSGVKEVVIGVKDPNPLTNGQSISKLKRAGIKVSVGYWEPELRQMNEAFEKFVTRRLPFVTAKCAQTLDGKIASMSGDSKWITAESTRKFSRRLRNDFDAILVGIETVLKDDPSLSAPGKSIRKIILDSSLRLPRRARLFKGARPGDIIVATTSKASPAKQKILMKKGMTVLVCPARRGRVDIPWLLRQLAQREICSLLIEGGATVIGSALEAGMIDKFHLYIAPKIVGDQRALSAVTGRTIRRIREATALENLTVQPLEEDLFIEAYVHRNR